MTCGGIIRTHIINVKNAFLNFQSYATIANAVIVEKYTEQKVAPVETMIEFRKPVFTLKDLPLKTFQLTNRFLPGISEIAWDSICALLLFLGGSGLESD